MELNKEHKKGLLIVSYLNDLVEIGIMSKSPIDFSDKGKEVLKTLEIDKIELNAQEIYQFLIGFEVFQENEISIIGTMIFDIHQNGIKSVKDGFEEFKKNEASNGKNLENE